MNQPRTNQNSAGTYQNRPGINQESSRKGTVYCTHSFQSVIFFIYSFTLTIYFSVMQHTDWLFCVLSLFCLIPAWFLVGSWWVLTDSRFVTYKPKTPSLKVERYLKLKINYIKYFIWWKKLSIDSMHLTHFIIVKYLI